MDATPLRLNLKRDQGLEIAWADGSRTTYPLALLRRMCPCAQCREIRREQATNPLRVLAAAPASGPVTVVALERVGAYAIKLTWSDGHDTGIYSFTWLREIAPTLPPCATPAGEPTA
jgi:DUF971 family protein